MRTNLNSISLKAKIIFNLIILLFLLPTCIAFAQTDDMRLGWQVESIIQNNFYLKQLTSLEIKNANSKITPNGINQSVSKLSAILESGDKIDFYFVDPGLAEGTSKNVIAQTECSGCQSRLALLEFDSQEIVRISVFQSSEWMSDVTEFKGSVVASTRNSKVDFPSGFVPEIIGGRSALPNEFPWMVRLTIRNSNGLFTCGGTYIAPSIVLTAQHCVRFPDAQNISVNYGSTDYFSPNVVSTENFVYNPNYTGLSGSLYDIALVILPTPIPQPTIQIANSTNDAQLSAYQYLSAAGWGLTSSFAGSQPSLTLQATSALTYIPNSSCSIFWGSTISVSQICAGLGFPTTCQGDSGGPLFGYSNGTAIQFGITSFGPSPCDKGLPTVFTRLSIYNNFISNGISQYGPKTTTLSVSLSGTGQGKVTSSPSGISCGNGGVGICQSSFNIGAYVVLSAAPNQGADFVGWTGNCQSSLASILVLMDTAKSCVASFSARPSISVNILGKGSGTVTSNPSGINCGSGGIGACIGQYLSGSVVTLSAAPDATSLFSGWQGDCSLSSATTISIQLAKNLNCSATFVPMPVITWRADENSSIDWLLNGLTRVDGGFVQSGQTGWVPIHLGDYTNSGRPRDILWGHPSGQMWLTTMDGLARKTSNPLPVAGAGWAPIAAADFNGDGSIGLLLQYVDGAQILWTLNGVTITGGAKINNGGTGWRIRSVADFNGDGKADFFMMNADGRMQFVFMNGTTIQSIQSIDPGPGWSPVLVNGQIGKDAGRIIWRAADGTSILWTIRSGVPIESVFVQSSGSRARPIDIGVDFDGDGNRDLLWDNGDGSYEIWLMQGATIKSKTQILPPGNQFVPVLLQDLNGDGTTDILFRSPDSAVIGWLMKGDQRIAGAVLAASGSAYTPVDLRGPLIFPPFDMKLGSGAFSQGPQ